MSQSSMKFGVAIFGLGRIGTIHLKNAVRNPRVSIKWIVEEDYDRAVRVKEECLLGDSVHIVNANDVDKVMNDKSVEVIIICTPIAYHATLIVAGCQAGKAVFCEKPIATTAEEVKTCYAAAKDNDTLLYCAFNRRFDPSIRELYTRVKAGEIDTIRSIKTTNRDHPRPAVNVLKDSNGLFHDFAIHDIDLVCWILGETPSTVYCQAHAFDPEIAAIGDLDQGGIMMQFPGGAIAHIDLNRYACYGYDQRLEVFGASGMLETRNQFPTSVHSNDSNGYRRGCIERSFPERYKESYNLEFEHFLNVYQGIETALDVSEEDCIRVTRLSECCEQSLKTGNPIAFKLHY